MKMKTRFFFLAILISLLGLAGCASGNKIAVGSEVELQKTSFSFDQHKAPYEMFPDYRLAPGDQLDVLFQIRTWVEKPEFKLQIDHEVTVNFVHAPELNLTQIVRPDGTITLPYLGVIRIIDKTVEEFSAELKEKYSTILKDPELYVLVPEFRASIKELKYDLHTAPRGLSRLVTIRPDGVVTFPMVGDLYVAGKTIPAVNEQLNKMYEEVLPDLHCDLFLEKHSGSVVYVAGQVKAPGSYPIVKPISVIEALTIAGSPLTGARLDSVIVVRKHEGKLVATRVDAENNLDFSSDSTLFYLQPDDIVFVPKTWVVKTAEVSRAIGDILFFRGWDMGWQIHNAVPTTRGSF